MRFYKIELQGPPAWTYTSLGRGGSVDPGALNVEFDIQAFTFAAPQGFAHIRVWGIPLRQGANTGPGIDQASDLNGSTIKVYAGMSKGLPLANPAQQGLILQGVVWQAFGNWIGVDMTLDLIVSVDGGATQSAPVNIVVDWKQGDKMSAALQTALSTAYPDYKLDIQISDDLVLTQDEPSHYETIEQLAQYVYDTSRSIINKPEYTGVQITLIDKTFKVFDGTVSAEPKQIAFTDLVGQPTWIGFNQVQVMLVMRGDLQVSDYVKFPETQQTVTAAQQGNQAKNRSAFTGKFQIDSVRHVGNYRQPDAQSWVTVIEAFIPPDDAEAAAFQPAAVG